MSRLDKYRGLASIALVKLSGSELENLHKTISNMSYSTFLELIRDIEDEIHGSINLSMDNYEDRSYSINSDEMLFREIDNIRKKELRITVMKFAELFTTYLRKSLPNTNEQIPTFDSRRGLQVWINKLARNYSEQVLFSAISHIKKRDKKSHDTDWKLR